MRCWLPPPRSETSSAGNAGRNVHFVVTTVHGTFASRAAWPDADSPLGRYLREHLPGSVEIRPFRWSGANGFRKREAAAHALREHLLRAMNDEPGAVHFVIAHSHGGNIAMLAAGEQSVEKRLAGIVCLSTPFLQARPRPLGAARIASAGAGVAITCANLLFLALRRWLDGNLALLIVMALYLPALLAAIALMRRLASPDRPRWIALAGNCPASTPRAC
jgi:Alpha/beta hydrolase family